MGFLGVYTTSKHAVVSVSEVLKLELKELAPGVGVTVSCPCLPTTGMQLPASVIVVDVVH